MSIGALEASVAVRRESNTIQYRAQGNSQGAIHCLSPMEAEQNQSVSGGRWRLAAFLLLGCAALAALIYLPITTRRGSGEPLHLKTYLRDGKGLENHAEVRIAGIRVGRVTMVRVGPEMPGSPVEVEILIDPGYRLMVPRDSKVRLGRAGLLGNTVIDIDVQFAKDPASRDGDVLRAD